MGIKNEPLKLFAIMFVLILSLGIGGSIFLRSYSEKKYPERFDEPSQESMYDKSFPQIVNIPSRSILVDDDFSFAPRLSPADNSVKLELIDSPEWLFLEDDVIYGVPKEVGTVSFVLRVEKGGRYVDQEFFLVVTNEKDE